MQPKRVMGTSAADGSFIKFPRVEQPLFKLFWFPYSAGAATSGAQFSSHLPSGTEVICFNSPSKQRDPTQYPNWQSFVDFLFPVIVADLAETPGVRFAFAGHSFGSLLVYLLLVYLRRAGHRMPEFVVISSKKAPQLHEAHGNSWLLSASFEETRTWYVAHHGKSLPERLLQDPLILKSIVVAFVADMKVNLSFWMGLLPTEQQAPLDVPCRLYWGERDDVVTSEQMQPWLELFPRADPITVFSGAAHMLFGPAEKMAEIMADISALIAKR